MVAMLRHFDIVIAVTTMSGYRIAPREGHWNVSSMPVPKGRVVHTTTYQEASLFHDLDTGHYMTVILHMLNQTPIHWFSKRQGRVQSATYGSEFMAARTTTEQIMDLRYCLCMMGVPIEGSSWMIGDNESVITSSTIPESSLNKWHNAL
jgi:hypothetical protein